MVMPNASQCPLRFASAHPRITCAGFRIDAIISRLGTMRSGHEGANSAPSGAMPGMGNKAMSASSSASSALFACNTPSIPEVGQGKPKLLTVAPSAAAHRAISCSRRSPPTTAILSPAKFIVPSLREEAGLLRSLQYSSFPALGTRKSNWHMHAPIHAHYDDLATHHGDPTVVVSLG